MRIFNRFAMTLGVFMIFASLVTLIDEPSNYQVWGNFLFFGGFILVMTIIDNSESTS